MNQLVTLVIGVPVLYLYAGLLDFQVLPSWLKYRRVNGSRKRYFLMTYIAFVMTIPVLYFGGKYIRDHDLGPSTLILLVAIPVGFAFKYLLVKLSRIDFA